MVSTSKVLTVSYGTFSCTLEGFDDSFDTMKAIAEYFRDLAADDRYFGAEPPTPDADMLARIAEREISRRVEAHEDNGSIHLRATEGASAVASAALLTDDANEALDAGLSTSVEDADAEPTAAVTEVESDVADVMDAIADETAKDAVEADDSADNAVTVTKEADTAFEKLQRIQSVVNGAEADPVYSEDEHATDIMAQPEEDVFSSEESLEELLQDIDIDLDADDADDIAEDDQENLEEAADNTEDTLAQLLADAMPAEESADDVVDAKPAAQEEPAEKSAADTEKSDAKVRIVKMKRADFEAAVSDGLIAEGDDDENIGTYLSADEESELRKELAAVEAELKTDGAERGAEGFAKLDNGKQTEDLSRIFDETASQLDEPEANERRNAIQHLRSAVAATRADDGAANTSGNSSDADDYREDLDEVVRPKRPAAKKKQSARPQLAPLRLVAEQRVDTPAEGGANSAPINPRRVKVQTVPQDAAKAGEFIKFINQNGAEDLSDIIQAAASFMVDQEGHDNFTRPMLIQKLKIAQKGDFSREESLRSYAQLLREGKLTKVESGRITVTDTTKYRDLDARRAV